MTTVAFPTVDSPLVSVVMVVYGGWEWVREALLALKERTSPCYEVILVDNASPDGTGEHLTTGVTGATIILNNQNVGFGAGANQGALHAVGRHLVFLNSDAFVQPGWLDPLLTVLDSDPGVAAVTPRLVDPIGTLQEAGGLVGCDSACQFGMYGDLYGDPDRSEYCFPRRVDYSSAAALMVRRRDFEVIGGFHPIYAMGYWEDVDLCLTLWDRGLATVYEPGSTVVHLRGASSTKTLAERYFGANLGVFMRRWSEVLAGRPYVGQFDWCPHRRIALRDVRTTDRVLLAASRWPDPEAGAWDAQVSSLIGELADMWPDVRFTLVVGDTGGTGRDPTPFSALGVEVAAAEDWDSWFDSRMFHYSSVVMLGTAAFESFDGVVGRTQPDALLALAVDGGSDDPEARRGLDASVVVLCPSDDNARAIAELAPGAHVGVLRPLVVPPTVSRSFFELDGVVLCGWSDGQALDLQAALDRLDPEVRVNPATSLTTGRVAIVGSSGRSDPGWSIVDAVAAGLPFVTTSEGAEDLPLGPLAELMVADGPDDLMRLASWLHNDRERWDTVRRGISGWATTRFDGNGWPPALIASMARLGVAPPGAPDPRPMRARPVRAGGS